MTSAPASPARLRATARGTLAATLVACAALAASAARADGDELQALDTIVVAARAAAAEATGIDAASSLEVREPDPRLRLPRCERPLAARLAPGTRAPTRLTIAVDCPRPVWRQYVPVRIRAEQTVVVLARPVARGQVLEAADLRTVRRDLEGLAGGAFSSIGEALGRIAQRPLGAGEVLSPAAARPAPLVRRGQQVVLLARGGDVQVRVGAVALSDGGATERIRVRNATSGRQVDAVVRSADTVEVAVE